MTTKDKDVQGHETKIVKGPATSGEEARDKDPKVVVKAAKVKTSPKAKHAAENAGDKQRGRARSGRKLPGRPVPKSKSSSSHPPIENAKSKKESAADVAKEAKEARQAPKAEETAPAAPAAEKKTAPKEKPMPQVKIIRRAADEEKAAAGAAESKPKAAPAAEKKPAPKAAPAGEARSTASSAEKKPAAAAEKKTGAHAEKKAAPASEKKTAAAGEKKAASKPVRKKNPDIRGRRQEIKIIKSAAEQKAEKAEQERKRAQREKQAAAEKKTRRHAGGAAPAESSSRGERKGRRRSGAERDKERNSHDKFSSMERKQQNRGFRSLEKKQRKKHVKQKAEPAPEPIEEQLPAGTKVINVPITIAGFSEQAGVSVSQVIMTLLKMGIIANQNQNIDETTVEMLGEELGLSIVIGQVEEEEELEEEGLDLHEDREKDLVPRPPIITVMGHVDHGKTSLLDAIRKTNVIASESGGITQHIGASEVEINGHKIVFLDTPGHEAFTAMRARGANITDIAVLVVAADDSVKPQTVESISHAKAANVPIIVAINKMDKPGANPDIVKKDLADHGVLVEDWGGDTICVPVSAKTGEGIKELLEMILLQAEVLELKANPNRLAMGTVLEARLDKTKGPVTSLLVTNGTLKAGQSLVAGTCHGKIRLMTNSKGETIRKAEPATAVEVLGLTDVPAAGDDFYAVSKDKQAREIAERRKEKQREEVMATTSSTTLEELFSSIKEGEVKELNLIIKADVFGSVGAIVSSLEKLSNDEVKVNIIHSGVGAINDSDVTLASTSSAIIIGFNVRPTAAVSSKAEREKVQIRTYRVIYDIIDDVENAMKGMLDPEFKEEVLGECEVRNTFKVPGVGIIAGGYVTNGKIVRNADIRLVRDGVVVHEGVISSLKRFKDDAREVAQGYECGIGIENYNDLKEGDIIECFHMVEVERN